MFFFIENQNRICSVCIYIYIQSNLLYTWLQVYSMRDTDVKNIKFLVMSLTMNKVSCSLGWGKEKCHFSVYYLKQCLEYILALNTKYAKTSKMKYKEVKNLTSINRLLQEKRAEVIWSFAFDFVYHCCHDDGLVTALTRTDNFEYFVFLKIYNGFSIWNGRINWNSHLIPSSNFCKICQLHQQM